MRVQPFKYAGFLSYAHADEAIAARLHRALETYPIPKNLGHDKARTLAPIFRDTAELTAHHSLSEKIQDAVGQSRFLIVLCSPASKTSHWVNEEIRLFRDRHGEDSILCALLDGTPETAFPPALTEGGREPLAANLSSDSFKLGTSQLAAAMLGVGLDDLIQRDAKRRAGRLRAGLAASLALSGIMGFATYAAIDARKEAENSRAQAEGLVEYMITDLKNKLEPLGKLEILDGVGDRAVEYYDAQNIADLPDESLSRQARARHVLGQVALDARRMDDAKREIEAAAALTGEVLERKPNDTDAIFAHSQSEYWVGALYYYKAELQTAKPHWKTYDALSQKLHATDPTNIDWVMEAGWGANNLAILHRKSAEYPEAQIQYERAIAIFKQAKKIEPENTDIEVELSNAIAGAADTALKAGNIQAAKELREQQVSLLENAVSERPDDHKVRYHYIFARLHALSVEIESDKDVCLANNATELLEKLDQLTTRDPSNYSWQHNYIDQHGLYLEKCLNLLPKSEARSQVKVLMSRVESRLKSPALEKHTERLEKLEMSLSKN